MATFAAACIRLATKRTSIITPENTSKKERTGNHFPLILNDCCNQADVKKESFMAAATPIIIAKNENTATIKPRLIPLIMASTSNMQKNISIIMQSLHRPGGCSFFKDHRCSEQLLYNASCIYLLDSSSFTAAEIVLPSAWPASCLVAIPITLPMSAGEEVPTCSIIFFKASFNSVSLI